MKAWGILEQLLSSLSAQIKDTLYRLERKEPFLYETCHRMYKMLLEMEPR